MGTMPWRPPAERASRWTPSHATGHPVHVVAKPARHPIRARHHSLPVCHSWLCSAAYPSPADCCWTDWFGGNVRRLERPSSAAADYWAYPLAHGPEQSARSPPSNLGAQPEAADDPRGGANGSGFVTKIRSRCKMQFTAIISSRIEHAADC
eukprot:scaffold20734_cov118-Isochrysis_galbana.AAC.9